MYCPRKKFLPACCHLSSVLLESEVWLGLHKLVHYSYTTWGCAWLFGMWCTLKIMLHCSHTTWGCADSFRMLYTFKIMLHYSDTTWGCADFFGVFQAVCRKGLVAGWWPFTGIDPFWVPGTQKGPVFKPRRGVQVKLWQWAWLGGADGLLGWVCCFFAFNIYTYVIFFIYRSRWKQVYKSSMGKVVPVCCACQLA